MSCETASLYIHIPFCSSVCDYCDFFSVTADKNDNRIDAFLKAVIDDIKYQIDYFSVTQIPTAYIGGGTPSILGRKIQVLLDELKKLPAFAPHEFTIEANPESISEEFLSLCRQGGVNRLSLGVQTFHEPSRNAVNRTGTAAFLQKQLSLASRFFNESLSADLIAGLPFQNREIILDDVKRLLEFNPVHVSLYSLSVEEGTPLEENIKNKKIFLPDNESSETLWFCGSDALNDAGFEHYEISNFSRFKKYCDHNIRYWQMKSWFGAGPAASGTIVNEKNADAKRFTYSCDVDGYINAPSIHKAVYEKLDKKIFLRDCLLMGFRCKEGPDPQLFKQRFGITLDECIPQTMDRWKNKNRMHFLNKFLADAFFELGNCKD